MKLKVRRITVVEEKNDLGSIWIERLIERKLLHELGLPLSLQAVILSKHYKEKGDCDDEKSKA
ncbi:MAG: hypothetical protein O2U61_06760 [Candidatus Bathyarchaeota archaeon]|nr:hypothetical protein [Candidatus Bathyarchaeota archaeon]